MAPEEGSVAADSDPATTADAIADVPYTAAAEKTDACLEVSETATSVSTRSPSVSFASTPAQILSSSSTAPAPRVRLVECGTLVGKPTLSGGGSGKNVQLQWARSPTGQWVKVLASTAYMPNRERDKQRVENSLGLPEFGDNTTEFWATKCGDPIACGYDRIVYGDHGPYVEFSPEHICWPYFQMREKPAAAFYDELWTLDGSTMLYYQKRPVKNKPNPPASGPWSVANNRSEGYANYISGKLYVAAEADTVTVRCMRLMQRRRRRGGRGKKGGASKASSVAADDEYGSAEAADAAGDGEQADDLEDAGQWDEATWGEGDWEAAWGEAEWTEPGWEDGAWSSAAGSWENCSAEWWQQHSTAAAGAHWPGSSQWKPRKQAECAEPVEAEAAAAPAVAHADFDSALQEAAAPPSVVEETESACVEAPSA